MEKLNTMRLSRIAWALGALGTCDVALSHEQAGVAGGLTSGFLHPLTGPDHLIAMVAVGLWGAQLGAPAIWILPVTFPMVMAFGGVLGVLGVALPVPELVIALSALVLGAVVALRLRLPLATAAALVGVFAVFHGHAHGVELPHAANPLSYGIGFVVSTGLLHVCGIALGTLSHSAWGGRVVQGLGAAIASAGAWFLVIGLGGLR